MFDRNQLVHAVIWPIDELSAAALIDTDGVIQGRMPVYKPVKGDELSRMIPKGYCLDFENCHVIKMSGDILVRTIGVFDTAVVTERAEVTFEERMQRLERRENYNARRNELLVRQNADLLKRLDDTATAASVTEAVELVEETPAQEAQEAAQTAETTESAEGVSDA